MNDKSALPDGPEVPAVTTNVNQIQLATIIAAHYTCTRASVDDWLRRRDQYLMIYITGSGATYGVYLSKSVPNHILLIVPALTIVILGAYLSADLHVAYLCKWLKNEYTKILENYVNAYGAISLSPWHWDNSKSLQEFYSSGVGQMRYIFLGSTFLIANASAPILAFLSTREMPASILAICSSAIVVSWITLFMAYLKRRTMA